LEDRLKNRHGWIALVGLLIVAGRGFADPLADYVRRPDKVFAWKILSRNELPGGVEFARVELTSQTWRGTVWKHQLTFLKPKEMKPKPTALIYVSGRYNPAEAMFFPGLARRLKQPIIALWNVPNEPLFGRSEDSLIAYTFERYLATRDSSWPLLFPMVKSVTRTMDAAQEFARQEWKTPLSGFVVTGASKRGWTTWLSGAVDHRVAGIVPMVYDNLNLAAQMKHQVESFGAYSEEIKDYSSQGLAALIRTPAGARLASMIDPFAYRKSLTMPKLIITGTNDRYWPLDAATLYYGGLPGPKNILYDPNSGHTLEDRMRVLRGIGAFWGAVSSGKRLPELQGTFSSGPSALKLTVAASRKPKAMRAWRAKSSSRDFRNAVWTSAPMALKGGRYVASLSLPSKGCVALFGEAEYDDGGTPYMVSTLVRIAGGKASVRRSYARKTGQ
jgi:PhoPQ-activated pathogenicity-related protein